MSTLTIRDKEIEIFLASSPDSPIIFINTYEKEGELTRKTIKERGLACNFSLVCISGLSWNKDLVPWDNGPTFKNGDPYIGGADEYCDLLSKEIVPLIENEYSLKPIWRGIAGYSLAGLFAIYSLYRSPLFSKAASISGSLWYPGFKDYLFSCDPVERISGLYFSLGSKENKTKNSYLASVLSSTEEIVSHYKEKGIKTFFEINPGNHFQDEETRTAKGIEWLLNSIND